MNIDGVSIYPKDVTEEMLAGFIQRFCVRNKDTTIFGNPIANHVCLKTTLEFTPLASEVHTKVRWYLISHITRWLRENPSEQLSQLLQQLHNHNSIWFAVYGLRVKITVSYSCLVTKLIYVFLNQMPGLSEETIKEVNACLKVEYGYMIALVNGKLPNSAPPNKPHYPGDVVQLKPKDES